MFGQRTSDNAVNYKTSVAFNGRRTWKRGNFERRAVEGCHTRCLYWKWATAPGKDRHRALCSFHRWNRRHKLQLLSPKPLCSIESATNSREWPGRNIYIFLSKLTLPRPFTRFIWKLRAMDRTFLLRLGRNDRIARGLSIAWGNLWDRKQPSQW